MGLKRKATYYRWIGWVNDGVAFTMQTKVYQCAGIYCVINHGSQHEQWSDTPVTLRKGQLKMIASLKKEGIECDLGSEITVGMDDKGFWKEEGQK